MTLFDCATCWTLPRVRNDLPPLIAQLERILEDADKS
jgi:hypothetical protein